MINKKDENFFMVCHKKKKKIRSVEKSFIFLLDQHKLLQIYQENNGVSQCICRKLFVEITMKSK